MSFYDKLSLPTTVAKQRVVETFSGDALDTDRWATVNVAGTNTFQMADSVDGGFEIISGATTGNRGMINFGGIRPFDPQAFELISTYSNGNIIYGMYYVGLTTGNDFPASAVDSVSVEQGNNNGNIQLRTSIGSANTTVASTTARSEDVAKTFKLVGTGSNVTMTINGIDSTVSTTNRPTAKMQPAFMAHAEAGAGARAINIRYFEAYNT